MARTSKTNRRKSIVSRASHPPNGRVEKSDSSDKALETMLKRLKETEDPDEIRQLSDRIERIVFHKQFMNA